MESTHPHALTDMSNFLDINRTLDIINTSNKLHLKNEKPISKLNAVNPLKSHKPGYQPTIATQFTSIN